MTPEEHRSILEEKLVGMLSLNHKPSYIIQQLQSYIKFYDLPFRVMDSSGTIEIAGK